MISVIAMDESRAVDYLNESEEHVFRVQEASERELIIEEGDSGNFILPSNLDEI